MRSEYIEAVDAVRWGWSLWVTFLVPAAIVWIGAIYCRRPSSRWLCYLAAVIAFWAFAVFHANHLQQAKEVNAEADAEWADWSSDVWKVFAPISSAVYAVVYCALHVFAAILVIVPTRWCHRRRRMMPNAA
jgi:hypothetical protein